MRLLAVNVDLGERSYPIYIGSGLMDTIGEVLAPHISGRQLCIVTNETIAPLYLEKLESQLVGYNLVTHILPDGEQFKTLTVLDTIFERLLSKGMGRGVTLLALGGGVVGDMTGFAAACFMRGVQFIQIPTTLLAQVDSSVGGKTAVNHAMGKNMLGAFHQPNCVVIDVDTLESLPERELSAGLAEVIKYGLIIDKDFFSWLMANIEKLVKRDSATLIEAIKVSCGVKAQVVAQDEKEKGLRALLNLGHTFGHALEAHYQYKRLLHGEAVAIGTCMAMRFSIAQGRLEEKDFVRVTELFSRAGLPVSTDEYIDADVLIKFMQVDKKAEDGDVRLIVLNAIGKSELINASDSDQLRAAIEYCMPH